MRMTLSSRKRTEGGAAAVEFAMVAMVLFILMIGIIQFAIYFWAYQVGSHAAREGARLGAVAPCVETDIEDRVIDRVGSAAAGAPLVDVIPPNPMAVGEPIEVTVTFSAHEIGFLPALPTVSKAAISRIEHIPAGGC